MRLVRAYWRCCGLLGRWAIGRYWSAWYLLLWLWYRYVRSSSVNTTLTGIFGVRPRMVLALSIGGEHKEVVVIRRLDEQTFTVAPGRKRV